MPKPLIIFDLNRTLYDPEHHKLVEGALEVVQACRARGYNLALVSRNEPGRADILKDFGLEPMFTRCEFVSEKNEEVFLDLLLTTEAEASKSFVIGDVLSQEIAIGKRCGLQTIWFCAGKFRHQQPVMPQEYPDYTVFSLWQALLFLPPV